MFFVVALLIRERKMLNGCCRNGLKNSEKRKVEE